MIEGAAEPVHVGAVIELCAEALFGSHVVRRAHDGSLAGEAQLGVTRPGEAEIGDLERARLGEEQVRRLDVTVDDAGALRVAEPARRLHEQEPALLRIEPLAAEERRLERRAAHELHRKVERRAPAAVGRSIADEVDLHDVARHEARLRLRLADEAPARLGIGRELFVQELDRHLAIEREIARGEDGAHGARAEALEEEAIDGVVEARRRWHRDGCRRRARGDGHGRVEAARAAGDSAPASRGSPRSMRAVSGHRQDIFTAANRCGAGNATQNRAQPGSARCHVRAEPMRVARKARTTPNEGRSSPTSRHPLAHWRVHGRRGRPTLR